MPTTEGRMTCHFLRRCMRLRNDFYQLLGIPERDNACGLSPSSAYRRQREGCNRAQRHRLWHQRAQRRTARRRRGKRVAEIARDRVEVNSVDHAIVIKIAVQPGLAAVVEAEREIV